MRWTVLRDAPGRLLASGLLVGALGLSGCGSTPAVCTDVDSLKSSVSALTDVKIQQGALTELQNKFAAVKKDFTQLKSDAKSQFGSEINAVTSAATAFKASLDAAIANPSATTLAAVSAAFQPLKTALTNLESAVKKTC
jgi:hypothetical protein